jgi:hypothetical protein
MDIEFKLFGAFSLRQFGYLAACVVSALVVYTLPLPDILKWPIVITLVMLGFALALVKINGLSFGTWLGNFIVALTTSQRRVWKKTPKTPDMLKASYKAESKYTTHLVSKAQKAQPVNMPLLNEKAKADMDKLDKEEQESMSKIDQHMQQNYTSEQLVTNQPQKSEQIEAQKTTTPTIIKHKEQNLATDTSMNDENIIGVQTGANITTAVKMENNQQQRPLRSSSILDDVLGDVAVQNEVQKKEQIKADNKQPINIPAEQTTTISTSEPKTKQDEDKDTQINKLRGTIAKLEQQIAELQSGGSDKVDQQSELATQIDTMNKEIKKLQSKVIEQEEQKLTPQPALRPNIISGIILDKAGAPIADVSIEVKDAEGFPLRKSFSDKNGQFTTKTPLPNGKYILDFEKQGKNFTDYNINLAGEILPPHKFVEA